MSLLTLIKAQFGKSNTPANNFVLDASANNGTLKLARGNAGATTQDILTVDAAGKVAFPQNPNTQIGVGQTWQDVTASRAFNTTYTNSTGAPIQVCVTCVAANGSPAVISIAGLSFTTTSAFTANATVQASFIVPNGVTYSVSSSNMTSLYGWLELR